MQLRAHTTHQEVAERTECAEDDGWPGFTLSVRLRKRDEDNVALIHAQSAFKNFAARTRPAFMPTPLTFSLWTLSLSLPPRGGCRASARAGSENPSLSGSVRSRCI